MNNHIKIPIKVFLMSVLMLKKFDSGKCTSIIYTLNLTLKKALRAPLLGCAHGLQNEFVTLKTC